MPTAALSDTARRTIFEAMVAMAWADSKVEREEVLAVQAAGRVLAVTDDVLDALDAGPPALTSLNVTALEPDERELVYVCAAWLATVDEREDASESETLGQLSEVLGLETGRASDLRKQAHSLRRETASAVPWWEELEELLGRVRAART